MERDKAAVEIDWAASWQADLRPVLCEQCNWRYLIASAVEAPLCPHCFGAPLKAVGEHFPYAHPPEWVTPFSLSAAALETQIDQFAKGIPYAPKDLHAAAIRSRLQAVYLPVWLVDGRACAQWQAELGFDYEVVSHQEQFRENMGGWHSEAVRENRIRWEERIGQLDRAYANLPAAALEEDGDLRQRLGEFDDARGQAYSPGHLGRALVRLPDRSPEDAWAEALLVFQRQAAADCQAAGGANHLRQFRWTSSIVDRNWTLLLRPVYTSYYLDDEGKAQSVLIHGQTGRTDGKRRASMRRAQQTSLIFLMIGLFLAVLGLAAAIFTPFLPVLGILALIGLGLGLPGILAALIPIGIAWDYNRKR